MPSKILVVGLGNPILGDDGVGWRVAEHLREDLADLPSPVEIDCLSLGGLSLMERLIGYERVLLIDAIASGKKPPGTVSCFNINDLPDPLAGHLGSAHDTSLQDAIGLGQAMGAQLPKQIWIVAVEAITVYDFSEQLTPAVADAVPEAVQVVRQLISQWTDTGQEIMESMSPGPEFIAGG
jgi:hydrogenase maturation protease